MTWGKRWTSLGLALLLLLSCLVGNVAATEPSDGADQSQTESALTIWGDAYYDKENQWYVLTEEEEWQSGALWFSQVRCNDSFSLSLDFYTGHAENDDDLGGADGICVAFYADGDRLGDDGEGLGFTGVGGYGVEIDTYGRNWNDSSYNHIAIIQSRTSNHLVTANAESYTEDGKWHSLRIDTVGKVCTVYVDGTQVLQYDKITQTGKYSIGISASTGTGYNYHAVRNIELREAIWNDDAMGAAVIPEGAYLIQAVSDKGTPLSDVQIEMDDTVVTTDSDGNAVFYSFPTAHTAITAARQRYRTWTNAGGAWSPNADGREKIVLYPEEGSQYLLREARYTNNKNLPYSVDLLTKVKTVTLDNPNVGDLDFGRFYLSCRAVEHESVQEYQLWQGETKIATSQSGDFSLSVDDFSEGSTCTVRAIGQDGVEGNTTIHLQFTKAKLPKETALKFGKGITFQVDESVPYVGGSDLSFSLPELPVQIDVTDQPGKPGNKYRFAFNLKLADSSDGKKESFWERTKKTFERAKNAGGMPLDRSTKDALQNLMAEDKGLELPGVGKAKLTFAGYAEADFGSNVAKGELFILMEVQTKTYGFTTVVGVVPITAQFHATGKLQMGNTLTYHWAENKIEGGIKLDVTVGLNAFGGVGIGKAVGVGAYGKASIVTSAQLTGTDPGMKKVDLIGELGLRAYLAWFTYEKAFAYKTWNLYAADAPGVELQGEEGATLYDASTYQVESLSYLREQSQWKGNMPALLAVPETTQLQSLLEHTYRNADPVMIQSGERIYAAFAMADPDTNQVGVALSVYNGAWSTPRLAEEAGVLDSQPVLLADETGAVWLSYARTSQNADPYDMTRFALGQQIVVAGVDEQGTALTAAVYTPEETGYAHMQTMGLVDGIPTLLWVESEIKTEDDVFASDRNLIRVAQLKDGQWQSAETLATVEHPVLQVAVTPQGAACHVDGDGDLNTTDDTVLCRYGWEGGMEELAHGVTGSITYASLDAGETGCLLWNGVDILLADNGQTVIAAPGITDTYAVTDDTVYYVSAADSGSKLMALYRNAGVWGEAVELLETADYVENLSAATLNSQDCLLGLETAVTIGETTVTPDKSLVWAAVQPTHNLALSLVEAQTEDVCAGEQVQVEVEVANLGSETVQDATVLVNGQAVGTCRALDVGERKVIPISITCPSTEKTYELCAVETGKNLEEDYRPEDNYCSLTLGQCNVSVELIQEQIGETRSVIATISNAGVGSASGNLVISDQDGTLLGMTYFSNLQQGSKLVVTPTLGEELKDYSGMVYAVVTVLEEEEYLFDNEAELYLGTLPTVMEPAVEIQGATSDGTHITVTMLRREEQKGMVYCAFYDSVGKQMTVVSKPLDDRLFQFEQAADAAYATVFVVDGESKPLCESVRLILSSPQTP